MFPGTPVMTGRRPLTAVSSAVRTNEHGRTRSAAGGSEMPLLPLSVVFDDLMRHYDHHTNYGCENEFYEFVTSQEICRKQWLDAELECIRHQNIIESNKVDLQRSEKRMHDVRVQLENKMETVARLESDNERMKSRMNAAMTLSKSYLNDSRVGAEAKDKVSSLLAILEGVEYKRPSTQANVRSPGVGLDTISEAETTDLSMTHSEDDLDYSVSRRTRSRRNGKRSSMDLIEAIVARESGAFKKRRSSGGPGPSQNQKHYVEITGSAQQVIAHTVVNIPRSGPAHAVSTLETVPAHSKQPSTFGSTDTRILHPVQPTAPMSGSTESDSDSSAWQSAAPMKPPHYQTRASLAKQPQVIQPPSSNESPRFGRTLSTTGGSMRPHAFVTKTVLKPETCEPCGKRIKFSKMALKCKECKATCHPECRDLVPLPCVIASTPGNKNQVGVIADYVPHTHPMVPALIQHCVNEVEVRGLSTVGLYRVPGPEKEVKDLKERFLRGKGVPNLGRYDIHAICGCIKDFLRSLQEPLVGRWFWRDFAAATEISDPITRQGEINRILDELPPPNQDTLAFVILHLQRVAELPEIKMPIGNLSKVFGPTIVGYSSADIDARTLLQETKKQQIIVETLLSMTSEFWRRFIYRSAPKEIGAHTRSRVNTMGATNSTTATPMTKTTSKSSSIRKKMYFADDSPKEVHFSRQKKTYFD